MGEVGLTRSHEPVREAAAFLTARCERVISERGSVRLAIPGGSALGAVGPLRAELGERFGKVRLTWVDERCVPLGSPSSNRGEAYRSSALSPDAPPELELPLFEDGETPARAAARVERALERDFGGALDVVLLGMGEDGHVASLFPGAPEGATLVAHVAESPKPPAERITLTRRALSTATTTVVLVMGAAKRLALERLLAGDTLLPATGLPGLSVFTDLEVSKERT